MELNFDLQSVLTDPRTATVDYLFDDDVVVTFEPRRVTLYIPACPETNDDEIEITFSGVPVA